MHNRSSRPAMRAAFHKTALATALAIAAVATITACQPAVGAAKANTPEAAAAPAVTVATVVQRAVEPQFAQVGRVEASQRVEIRPRVAGHIEAVLFHEGEIVRAGQALFRIDTRPFDAALARAQADLQLALAKETLARSEAERAQRLQREQAIAVEEAERRNAALSEAQARTAAARAAVQAASLDREFAIVKAPVDGRIGRALVTAGNYVGASSDQAPLATLTGTAPLHVYFDAGDPALISQLIGNRKAGKWQARILDSHSDTELATAPIDFVDTEIASQTGTLRLRARIDKPRNTLVPGQFVRVQLAGAARDGLLVPEKAIASDQGQRFVMVVKDQQVEHRFVKVGAQHGEQRIVNSGLKAGEQVIVSGLMKVRPGMKVQPQPVDAKPGSAQAQPVTSTKS
ncbi:efflux RND transporter periplasmic adaptor subunit [Rhodoferax sp.]|uniref:efflux RND transporter periplasmic adaptor subunit n=1 Tax=Rhodoferax sp. TaxID=50421 RepID=UPI00272FC493|nr:efflux RND transporter periplasmic adaptor subunit [Rhodoferax sp.]MDP1531207.1 efflux RND transporter periplasmic adaptor subunit [Rhodoferax sp.]MDP1942257.1 efflux RND transporter periplasmic adaptor subunit [Rhodoferax sp.]MDP2441277.1 efflux RND transporter periplasmic adaptor subunit [Rhodoferax sp.]MDZ4207933.1 efflux RND transporter periplasmic adaptor subunit [Rhodoferax sp.]